MSAWSIEHRNSMAILTFTSPPRNTMTFAAMAELAEHLQRIAQRHNEITTVVLTGGIDGFFVAHADITELVDWSEGRTSAAAIESWDRALRLLEEMPQVTVAAIDGQAWGGGCEIALACDLRIASDRADLGQPEVRVGLIPGAGGSVRLPRLIGQAKATELILTATTVGADQALALGLVNVVLATPGFRQSAIEWATRLTRFEPAALFAAKSVLRHTDRDEIDTALRHERELFTELARTSAALRTWTAPDDETRRHRPIPDARGTERTSR
jgi:enoyl-CoA hydratase